MLAGGVMVALLAVFAWRTWGPASASVEESTTEKPAATPSANELRVSRDILAAAGVEAVSVAARPASERLQAAGVVEPNQLQIQQVTPLIAGRVDRVAVTLGDRVQGGTLLFTVSSPQIAELQGNLRSAEAKLAETEATCHRAEQLVELGAMAGKELVTAETEFRAAQAQVAQLRQSLTALGAADDGATGAVAIRAPMAGTVIERTVNPGAWIAAGTSPIKLANLATVWVIVNVPESRVMIVRQGAAAEIHAPTLGNASLAGRVSYIDPQLDQATRTARVHVEVPNAGQVLKMGMFVDVMIQGTTATRGASELIVPSEALQRIGERTVVFMPTDEPERFTVRDVEVGDEVPDGYIVRQGVAAGDRVVSKGGFTLKSQLLKGQFGEEEEISGGKER